VKIQVNSDKTLNLDASMTLFVEGEVSRILRRFEKKLTRAEVHLSDVDNKKTGHADKRCLIEVRPAGDRPLSVNATTVTTESAVGEAARKMQRSLTTFFARKGRPAVEISAPSLTARKSVAKKATTDAKKDGSVKKKTAAKAKKTAAKKPTKLSPRGPKKKGVYQARRKSQPAR
jgi:Sigma 54 modulation protein / S30EA ribosomal protein